MGAGRTVMVGVAGGSGSGKTTVVRRIVEALGPEQTVVLHHDSYYRDRSRLDPAARVGINYDHPDALETDLLAEHLEALLAGTSVDSPVYDFAEHVRLPDTVRVEPRPVIIVDGFLILNDPRLRRLMDVKVFVDTDADTRLERRLERDVQQRGRSEASVRAQFTGTVEPMHQAFVQPTIRYADIVIRGGGHNVKAVERAVQAVRSAMEESQGPPDRGG
jgi:uridine kinase